MKSSLIIFGLSTGTLYECLKNNSNSRVLLYSMVKTSCVVEDGAWKTWEWQIVWKEKIRTGGKMSRLQKNPATLDLYERQRPWLSIGDDTTAVMLLSLSLCKW